MQTWENNLNVKLDSKYNLAFQSRKQKTSPHFLPRERKRKKLVFMRLLLIGGQDVSKGKCDKWSQCRWVK